MRLLPIHRKILIRKLKKLGFIGPYIGGNHEYLINENGYKVTIPNTHSGKDIPVPIISAILRQIGVSRNDFIKL